ncbi:hypothetical protein VaNZ11_013771 [Volvox africanus]|uniref:Elongator complex protein 4 n=1 Tax=Volvox africanus TaxID=51714 RepID=A0ABQ5SIE0_9CHLO|nr:hypothetical protein VaNZ11_013771 [Volvox africanus]
MSSFRRAGVADTGIRPGLHGQTLISMGLVDLDRLLSGGLPLASVLLILEDAYSGQHLNLMRYFIAEGLACRQRVLWLTGSPPPGGPAAFLPAEASPSQSGGSVAEDDGGKEQPELRIAWQYKKYIKDDSPVQAGGTYRPAPRSSSSSTARTVAAGVGREWCHSYDLTRPMGEEALGASSLDVVRCSGPNAYGEADAAADAFLSSLRTAPEAGPGPGSGAATTATLPGQRSGGVGRLVFESAGSLAWGGGGSGASEQMLLRLLYNVRRRAMQARCAVMMTVPAGLLSPGCAARLPHLADTVLALEGLMDDMPLFKLLPDPNSAVALLSLRKVSSAGMVGPRLPDGQLYVVRNKRRRLALSPVEVDPDAEERQAEAAAKAAEAFGVKAAAAAGGNTASASASAAISGSAGSAGGRKNTAALLCGGPPAAGNKALDF